MKVAAAAGITAYLKQAKVKQYFDEFLGKFFKVGSHWTSHKAHGELFEDFEDVGGLEAAPPEIRSKIVLWMVRCYLGEPGGYGAGLNRPVFYSNSAAPLIEDAFTRAGALNAADVENASKDKLVKAAITSKHIARRLERLRDLVSG
jgi:hypothetical protein